MSRLYYTENGHVMPSLCEELTRFRRIRKHLRVPSTASPATLFVLARPYPQCDTPLHVTVNGHELDPVQPMRPGAYSWYAVPVDPHVLDGEDHVLELWTESVAMDSWSVALEAGHAAPGSERSDDGGATWRRERMGYLNNVLAEYVIRLRVDEGVDARPPAMVWEDRQSPRMQALRESLPDSVTSPSDPLDRVRAISTWLASSWEHTGSGRAEQYGPWDAETLLAWAPGQVGHNGKRPIAMCVHYAAAMTSIAQAVEIPARCAVLTEAVNGAAGHFIVEAWIESLNKWVVVDPNSDALFVQDGVPMNMTEIQQAGEGIGDLIEFGPGTEFQLTFPHIVEFCEQNLKKGVCFRHRSVWHRADLLTRPDLTPPGHGSISYCETGLVWEGRDREAMSMFPFHGDPAWFDAPPEGF